MNGDGDMFNDPVLVGSLGALIGMLAISVMADGRPLRWLGYAGMVIAGLVAGASFGDILATEAAADGLTPGAKGILRVAGAFAGLLIGPLLIWTSRIGASRD